MKLVLIAMLAVSAALAQDAAAEPAKPAPPPELTDAEKLAISQLRIAAYEALVKWREAERDALAKEKKLAEINARLDRMHADLVQQHNAHGWRIDLPPWECLAPPEDPRYCINQIRFVKSEPPIVPVSPQEAK